MCVIVHKALICNFKEAYDVEHVFSMSSSDKCPHKSFTDILIGLFVFLLLRELFLYSEYKFINRDVMGRYFLSAFCLLFHPFQQAFYRKRKNLFLMKWNKNFVSSLVQDRDGGQGSTDRFHWRGSPLHYWRTVFVMDLIVLTRNQYVELLTLSIIVFGDRASMG